MQDLGLYEILLSVDHKTAPSKEQVISLLATANKLDNTQSQRNKFILR